MRIVAALLLLALAIPWGRNAVPRAGEEGEGSSPARERLQWGVYQIHWGSDFPAKLAAGLAPFASQPDYVMFYRDLGRPFPAAGIEAIRAHGATPIISLELWHWMRRGPDDPLPGIADGRYDEDFAAWADAARRDGKRILLRFGFEMNGEWFTWSLAPALYKKAWRRVHAIFARQEADNVEWVWSPNVVSVPDTPEHDLHLYYPGDDVVDWVGLDGYNFGDRHDEWHEWESFEHVFGEVLPALEKRYPEKPIMICETGCPPGTGTRREEWIREAYAYLQGRPRVKALVWFNLDKRREGEPDWRIGVTPASLRAFNETFARPPR